MWSSFAGHTAKENEKAICAEEKRLYSRYVKQIHTEYKKMENCYLHTAFALHALYSKKLYKVGGYQNIYDLASDMFTISRGTCNNFINICEKFGCPNENGTVIGLQESFKDYGMSQLIVMLTMNQELLNMCKPSMSVRELKAMKNSYIEEHEREIKQISASDSDNVMNEPEESSCDSEYAEDYSQTATDGKLFVCSATSYDELVKLRDIIIDSMNEVKKNDNVNNPRFELNIVF